MVKKQGNMYKKEKCMIRKNYGSKKKTNIKKIIMLLNVFYIN